MSDENKADTCSDSKYIAVLQDTIEQYTAYNVKLEAEVERLKAQLSVANQAILDMNVKMTEWIETLKQTGGTQC